MRKSLKKEKGITLIALSVTIIILIILAGITIRGLFGENGLVEQAKRARDDVSESTQKEKDSRNKLLQEYDEMLSEETSEGEENPPEEEPSGETLKVEEVKGGEPFSEKTKVIDSKGNEIMVPAGFKIASDSGNTVQEGIVIEDVNASGDANVQGSQYVWIPVGTFKKDDGSTSEQIKLGRYTFNTTTGEPTLVQSADNYTDQSGNVVIDLYYKELISYREGVESYDEGVALNTTAYDLKGFIDSVKTNGGYYIGRYEASYASGALSENTIERYMNCKAASKVSQTYITNYTMSYVPGTLWSIITQTNASKVALYTYGFNSSVKSDLVNSYAWDTAIVYIQEAGNSNYANKKKVDINENVVNTGENKDEVCKINDMASNLEEWTTEFSSGIASSFPGIYTVRGGGYYDTDKCHTARRGNYFTNANLNRIGFRIILYM